MNNSAQVCAVHIFDVGAMCTFLVNLSTKTRIAPQPALVLGRTHDKVSRYTVPCHVRYVQSLQKNPVDSPGLRLLR